jgi:hypothetical protein
MRLSFLSKRHVYRTRAMKLLVYVIQMAMEAPVTPKLSFTTKRWHQNTWRAVLTS